MERCGEFLGAARERREETSVLNHEHTRPVGLDIGTTAVKLIELSGSEPPYELETIALVSLTDVDEHASACARAISLILESNSIGTEHAATSVCGSNVAVRDLRFPKLDAKEVQGAVWYEGSQVIAFDINDAYVDYAVMGDAATDADKLEVLFVAALRPEVDVKTRIIEASGLEPRLVGIDMLVMLDALMLREDIPETVALLDIGAKSTGIGIARAGSPPFVRDLEIAGNAYTQAIAEELDISFAQAETAKIAESASRSEVQHVVERVTDRLVRELKRSLVYYQTREHGSDIKKIYVCGGSSRLPGLTSAASEALGIPVEHWSPIHDVKVDGSRFDLPSVEQLGPFVSLATALAMQEATH
jgi:type IV pilus assembly protein PilM